jgi:hypothetical protein
VLYSHVAKTAYGVRPRNVQNLSFTSVKPAATETDAIAVTGGANREGPSRIRIEFDRIGEVAS